MFSIKFASIFGILAVFAAAHYTHEIHEHRNDVQIEQWMRGARVHPDTLFPVRIGLMQSNLDKGHDELMKISDPKSSQYGKHWSAEEVVHFFAPAQKSIDEVKAWLESQGFGPERASQSPNKQWIQFEATTAQLEALLHTTYHVWHHHSTGEQDIACESYFVPRAIRRHIDYITPGIRLRSFVKHLQPKEEDGDVHSELAPRSISSISENPPAFHGIKYCATNMVPQCIMATYNISKGHSARKGNEMGFYEGFGDVYYQPDMDNFTIKYYPRIPQGFAPKHLSINGATLDRTKSKYSNAETMLDIQIAAPIIYPQNSVIWQVNVPDNTTGWFNTWLDAIDGSYCNYTAYGITGDSPGIDKSRLHECGIYKPTNVISVSYGGAEAALPANYVKRQCNEYMKLGMQGICIFYCTQDVGVAGGIGGGKNLCLGKKGKIFAPIWPASCPYVTSVGGTAFHKGDDILDHTLEYATFFSGGGFSNVFETPSYQKKAAQTYLTKHKPDHPSYSTKDGKHIGKGGGLFNRNGRGYPDVSAMSRYIAIAADGYRGGSSGTSASTPLWAAIFNRINEERLAAGKSTVGFVNPALYAHPELMHDITKGFNANCGYKKGDVGFNATKGWDAVTDHTALSCGNCGDHGNNGRAVGLTNADELGDHLYRFIGTPSGWEFLWASLNTEFPNHEDKIT